MFESIDSTRIKTSYSVVVVVVVGVDKQEREREIDTIRFNRLIRFDDSFILVAVNQKEMATRRNSSL